MFFCTCPFLCLLLSLSHTHTKTHTHTHTHTQWNKAKSSMSNNWIPISIQNESHVETRMCVTLELIVTGWWLIMSALGSHVYLWRKRHPRLAQIHVYTVAHGLDVSLQLVLSRHPSSPFIIMIFWIQHHRGGQHIFSLTTNTISCAFVKNSHPEVAQIHADTHSVHIWLLLYSFCALNFRQVLQSQRHCIPFPLTCSGWDPLHTLAPYMFCLSTATIPWLFVIQRATENRWNPSLYARLPRVTENRWNTSLHARNINVSLHLCSQSPSIIEVSRVGVQTCIWHIFFLTMTVIPCVSVQK